MASSNASMNVNPRRVATYPLYHTTLRKPRRWPLVLRMTKGSVHRDVLPTVFFHCLFTCLIIYLHKYVQSVGRPSSIIPALSIVVGLMLVFRNGSSYDRFWNGRKELTTVVASVRNLTRYFLVSSRNSKDESSQQEDMDTDAVVRVLIATLYAVKENLRADFSATAPGTPAGFSVVRSSTQISEVEPLSESMVSTLRPEYSDLLPSEQITLEDQGLSMPLQLAVSIEAYIRRGVIRGWWAPPQASFISGQLANLVTSYGTMETIKHTPLPVAYIIHTRQVLALYLMVLPFAMVDEMGWWAAPIMGVASFTLWGIEAIGSQLEDPFGYDKNDIKMDPVVEDARVECDALLAEWRNKTSDLFTRV